MWTAFELYLLQSLRLNIAGMLSAASPGEDDDDIPDSPTEYHAEEHLSQPAAASSRRSMGTSVRVPTASAAKAPVSRRTTRTSFGIPVSFDALIEEVGDGDDEEQVCSRSACYFCENQCREVRFSWVVVPLSCFAAVTPAQSLWVSKRSDIPVCIYSCNGIISYTQTYVHTRYACICILSCFCIAVIIVCFVSFAFIFWFLSTYEHNVFCYHVIVFS